MACLLPGFDISSLSEVIDPQPGEPVLTGQSIIQLEVWQAALGRRISAQSWLVSDTVYACGPGWLSAICQARMESNRFPYRTTLTSLHEFKLAIHRQKKDKGKTWEGSIYLGQYRGVCEGNDIPCISIS